MYRSMLSKAGVLSLVLTLILVACGGDDDAASTSTTRGQRRRQRLRRWQNPPRSGCRLTHEGDPMVAWMIDTGLVAEMEQKYNVKFV